MAPFRAMQHAAEAWPGDVEPGASAVALERPPVADERLRRLLDAHFREVWRVLRRLGVPSGAVDDAAQQVFIVASGKLDVIADGSERAFLVGTAVRVAANVRRAASLRREKLDDAWIAEQADPRPAADALVDEKRLRALLDHVLESLPDDLRTVLVLFELEGVSCAEIAELVGIPAGTAASRLRRAREEFQAIAKRLRARLAFRGGA